MKGLLNLLGLCGALAVASESVAQLLKPADVNQQAADVNGKVYKTGNVELKTLTQPQRSFPHAPQSGVRMAPTQLEMKGVTLQQLKLSTLSKETVPLQNFAAKRAVLPEKEQDEKRIPHKTAPIKDRRLRALTPAGEEELKDQLNKRY